jgi:hypothetical protein
MTNPRLVKLISPGVLESKYDGAGSQGQFAALGGVLVFLVSDDLNSQTREAWRSDGSAEGTFRLATDLRSGLYVHEDSLFFNTSQGLWISDGYAGGGKQLNPYVGNDYIGSIARLGDTLIASTRNGLGLLDKKMSALASFQQDLLGLW